MKKLKTILLLLLCITLLPISVFAEGNDNADSGGGGTKGAVKGKGFYRGGEWMYKVSVYVGLSDRANTHTSLSGYKMIGSAPIFIKPSSFALPSGVIFGKHSKVDYLKGAGLESNDNPKIVTDNPPPPPITNGGKISAVKSYFGDTLTLKMLLTGFAEQKGTTREGLIRNIKFTIDGKKGKKDPKDILPIKGADGKYQNKVPWVIIYEPVTIAYLKDKQTKLAFTATEYALAQKMGLFNFFYSGDDAQYIAGMTHANLPNSIVLEQDWFGFTAYPPSPPKVKWDNNRIIQGGGWGMRFLGSKGKNANEPIKPPANGGNSNQSMNINMGDYRVDTDVITSFTVGTGERITPNNPATVTIYVDGRAVLSTDIVLPEGGSQLVWTKWHTPSTPQEVLVSASISGNSNAYFIDGNSKWVKVADLNENVPPDPRAKDPKTGKVVTKPNGWKVPKLPKRANNTSATWGTWSAFWKSNWVWHEDWQWRWTGKYNEKGEKIYDWFDEGEWVDEGDWEYFWNSYSATLSATYRLKPDDKVPTAKQFYNRWEMGSGYGVNIQVDTRVLTNAPSSAIAMQGNVINYFPEFNYDTYCRLSERIGGGKFEFRQNKYSTYNRRVHYTPLWFPNGERYMTYSEVMDIWTPAGMLTIGLDDYIDIKGNVFDDWRVVPVKP
ncbi:hypothetical protein [Xylanivirga thermophila]|uniref:hypothetical protein n=1 Tax=Xylanivirga thermophila TaxID=2496273 RepID=UPI00101B5E99|nr:hypothetical protein [Xylanivirga thermophila]